jgi:hypothetical protein
MPENDTRRLRRARPSGRQPSRPSAAGRQAGPRRPTIAELLETPGALLTRSHLRALGLERRAIDAVFRALPIVFLPGYARPMVRAADYIAFVEESIYRDDRVRPT